MIREVPQALMTPGIRFLFLLLWTSLHHFLHSTCEPQWQSAEAFKPIAALLWLS